MPYLSLFALLALLFVNLWGGALLVGWFWRSKWLAVSLAPIAFVTLFFGVESIVGLGAVRWLCVITTLTSLGLIQLCRTEDAPNRWNDDWLDRLDAWRSEFSPSSFWPAAAVFLAFFFYALAWRWAYPDIDGSSEKLSDFSYICSYLPGGQVPVVDAWFNPFPSVHYYSFQHYAAALMGRMLGLSPGLTYNLAFCVLVGLAGSAFTGAVVQLVTRRWIQVLAVIAFTFGGSGAAGFVHLFYKEAALWNGNRFIGSREFDQAPVGTYTQQNLVSKTRVELPGEPFAYTIFLGDYHPPLSSYYVMGLGVMGAAVFHRTRRRRYAGVAGASLTWCILANTWVFPFQGLMIALWWLWERDDKRRSFVAIAAGALAVWSVSAAFLQPFIAASAEYKTAFRLVTGDLHTPLLLGLLYLLPPIGISVACLYSQRKTGFWIGAAGLCFLLISEFLFVDDIYSGEFERFNSTLKWWPWIGAAAILAGAWLLDVSRRSLIRVFVLGLLVYPCAFGVDLLRHWYSAPKPSAGALEGNAYLMRAEASKVMLTHLRNEPAGIVAERPNKDSYTNSACLPLFAGHRLWLGWVGHEALWHGYTGDVWQRQDRLMAFFKGETPELGGDWMATERIDYVLWYQEGDTNELWEIANNSLRSHYSWRILFNTPEGKKVGYWVRNTRVGK